MPRLAVRNFSYSLIHPGVVTTGETTDPSSTDWTAHIWASFDVDPNSIGPDSALLAQKNGAGIGQSFLYVEKSTGTYATRLGGAGIKDFGITPVQGDYSLKTLVYDNTANTLKLYIKGILVSTLTSVVIGSATGEMLIGDGKNGSIPWLGKTTNFSFFTRAQGDTEIAAYSDNNFVDRTGLSNELLYAEGTGTTMADTSGNGNDATITNLDWSPFTPFESRSAVLDHPYSGIFDGASVNSEIVSSSTDPGFDVQTFTMAAWVNPSTIDTTFRGVMQLDDGGTTKRIVMMASRTTNKEFSYFDSVNTTVRNSGVVLEENEDQFIGITVDGLTLTFYVNGKTVSQQTLSSALPTGQDRLRIGSLNVVNQQFAGGMSRNWLFGSALTPDQMWDLYKGEIKPSAPLTEYKYTDGSGPTVTDTGSLGIDGTMGSGVTWSGEGVFKPRTVTRHFDYGIKSIGGTADRLVIVDSVIAPTEFQTLGSDGGSYSIMIKFKTVDDNVGSSAWQSNATLLDLRQQASTDIKGPFNIGIESNKLHFGRTPDGSASDEIFLSTANVNDGKYKRALITVNDDTLKFFIKGDLDSEHTFTVAIGDCSVGAVILANLAWFSRSGNSGAFASTATGIIDEVAIWEDDLSDAASELNFEITDLLTAGNDYTQAMVDNLKYWATPSEGSLSSVADNTAFANTGTMVRTEWTGDTSQKRRAAVGRFTQSLDMTDGNDRVDDFTTFDPATGTGFSLYSRVKFASIAGTKTWYAQETGTGTQGRSWARLSVGELGYSIGGAGVLTGVFVEANKWYEFAHVYDNAASTYSIYEKNRGLVFTATMTAEDANGMHVIGENNAGSNDFNGFWAGGGLYTVPHDQFTVMDILRTGVYQTQNANYLFELKDTIGATITDTSGNGNDGTNTGGTASTDDPDVARTSIT